MSFGPRLDKRGRLVCWCTGYWFPHRKSGGACEHSKTREIHLAVRSKDPELLLDALLDHATNHRGTPTTKCPF